MPWRCFNHAVCGTRLPRASANSLRCTGNACKDALRATRQQQGGAASSEGLVVAAAQATAEEMPDGMSVHEIEEILGERSCKPSQLSKLRRKNGPGTEYHQEFLVRGSFLQPPDEDEDGEREVDDTPEPDMFWVGKADLLRTIHVNDVKEALVARHERVLGDLPPAKKARRA